METGLKNGANDGNPAGIKISVDIPAYEAKEIVGKLAHRAEEIVENLLREPKTSSKKTAS